MPGKKCPANLGLGLGIGTGRFCQIWKWVILCHQARLAQSVEHETLNLRVVGSSPTLGVHLFRNPYLCQDIIGPVHRRRSPAWRHGLVG